MKRRYLIASLCAMFAFVFGGVAAGSVAWFNVVNNIEKNVSGSALRNYFHCGSGTEDDPFVITRPVHYYNLVNLQNELDGFAEAGYYFQLGYDLDGDDSPEVYSYDDDGLYQDAYSDTLNMAAYSAIPPCGNSENPFLGKFYGQGLTISGLNVSSTYTNESGTVEYYNDIGIFGYFGSTGYCENTYFESPTIDMTGADPSATSTSDHSHTHTDNIYVGYLAGHTKYAGNFQNVYVNNCDTVGTASNAVSINNYGYFGYVEYTGDGLGIGSGTGSALSDGNDYSFTMDPEAMYNALDDVYTDHGSDYLITRNRSDNVTTSDATTLSTVLSQSDLSRPMTVSDAYRIEGTDPNNKSATNYSLSTIGYYGTSTKSVSISYGSSHTALPTTMVSTSTDPDSTTESGDYLYYNSTAGNWQYFVSEVSQTAGDAVTATFNVFTLNSNYSSGHYLATDGTEITIVTSISAACYWCLMSSSEASSYCTGISEDTTFGLSSIATGTYYLFNPYTKTFAGAVSSTGYVSVSTYSDYTSASTYTISQYSSSVYYFKSGNYIGYRNNSLYSASSTARYYRWIVLAATDQTESQTSYTYTRSTTLQENVYYTEDNSTYSLLTDSSASFGSTYQTANISADGSSGVYVGDLESITSTGYNSDNLDMCGGIYFGLDAAGTNYCVGLQGYGTSGIAPTVGNVWYPDLYAMDCILMYIVNTGTDNLGSIDFEYYVASGTTAPMFHKGQGSGDAADNASFEDLGATTTSGTRGSYTTTIASVESLSLADVEACSLCALDSSGNVYAIFDTNGNVSSHNTSVDGGTFSESYCAMFVLALSISKGGAYVYEIDFNFTATHGSGGSGFSSIVDYRSASDTVTGTILNFYVSIAQGVTVTHLSVSYSSSTYAIVVSADTSLSFTIYLFDSDYSVTVNGSALSCSSSGTNWTYSP